MTKYHEQSYLSGRRAGIVAAMNALRVELGDNSDPMARLAALETERVHAVNALRDMYQDLVSGTDDRGDFPDELWLPDIIEKHLHRRIDL